MSGLTSDFFKAPPHNSAARLAMSFPPSAACKFLDLHPVNLRNLHLHLTKNPFASRPPHLCGVTLMSNDCVCVPVIAHFSLLILRFFTESWGKEQLGGASADAQSYWQGRFAACAFVGGFLGIGRPRNSWGVAPTPTGDRREGTKSPLDPARGNCPLTLFGQPGLGALPYCPLSGLLGFYKS